MTKKQNNKTFIIGCTSGMIIGAMTAGLFHPIDSIRVRSFLNPNNMGTFYSLKNGLTFNIISSGTKAIVSFPIREHIKKNLSCNYSSTGTEFISSVITGTTVGLIGIPMNVVKVRTQNHTGLPISSLHIAKNLYNNNGLKGFYLGGQASMIRDIIWNIVYFPTYDLLIRKYQKNEYINNKLLASISSSMLATTFAYPFDGIRLFKQKINNNDIYKFWHGFKKSFEFTKTNAKSYFCAMIRVPMATSITHMGYLYLNDKLNNMRSKNIQKNY